MKTYAWILLSSSLFALGLAANACGGDSTYVGGSAPTTSTTSVSSSSSSGAGGKAGVTLACSAPMASPSLGACWVPEVVAPTCAHPGVLEPEDGGACNATTGESVAPACLACGKRACCAEIQACVAIDGCPACALGNAADPAACDTPEIQAAMATLSSCLLGCCSNDCPFVPGCNPVTNTGCDATKGEVCDTDGAGSFRCYPKETLDPNAAPPQLCEGCGTGNWCAGGLACIDGLGCAKYCCDDGDCGGGFCDTSGTGTVGVCLVP
jgi:hypothetical protein